METDPSRYHGTFRNPPAHPFSHNAFHVWDQDDIILPPSRDDSPLPSPLLLAAIPYIPSFFPLPHSPTAHGSPGLSGSPGQDSCSVLREF